jgi:hypothetical protein
LLDDGQMSSLRWLEAGATASYGNVSEPCNSLAKIPQSRRAAEALCTAGEQRDRGLLEERGLAGAGLFIGEPLARRTNAKRAVFPARMREDRD